MPYFGSFLGRIKHVDSENAKIKFEKLNGHQALAFRKLPIFYAGTTQNHVYTETTSTMMTAFSHMLRLQLS